MKQVVILSGKGGTGKTSLVAAFAHLANAHHSSDSSSAEQMRLVLVDADVDASNLELVLQPRQLEAHDFIGGELAVVDPALCSGCGICVTTCRFDAISVPSAAESVYAKVDEFACEGCAACVYACPQQAIQMQPQRAGWWFRSATPYGPLFHAALRPGAENSGKLVTLVKQMARLLALDEQYPLVLVDGPPGIGCPVISAAAGADLALIVTEPSVAGLHDLERAWGMTHHFGIPTAVTVNKADIYPQGTHQIKRFCREKGLPLLGAIPFDLAVTHAMVNGRPVTTVNCPASQAISAIWSQLLEHLENPE
ncbi:MAG: (4Fe-4S)-binding protein [Ardenticatenia bacterium]|nr:MAG: (4Fe-4S)-binding protein [Ardenticatenia bacterium]